MNRPKRRRSITTLFGLILLALVYGSLEYFQHTVTGATRLDGIIGVMLGLYICSVTAANVLDMFFEWSRNHRQDSAGLARQLWLPFNILTLFSGLVVIFMGAIQFTRAGSLPPAH